MSRANDWRSTLWRATTRSWDWPGCLFFFVVYRYRRITRMLCSAIYSRVSTTCRFRPAILRGEADCHSVSTMFAACLSSSTRLTARVAMDKKSGLSRRSPETGRSLDFPRSVLLGERSAIDRSSLRLGCLVSKYRDDVFSQGEHADRCRVTARPTGRSPSRYPKVITIIRAH